RRSRRDHDIPPASDGRSRGKGGAPVLLQSVLSRRPGAPPFPLRFAGTGGLRPTKNPPCGGSFVWNWQPRMDSNHRMPESESGALPLGDGAMGPSLTPERAPANTLD